MICINDPSRVVHCITPGKAPEKVPQPGGKRSSQKSAPARVPQKKTFGQSKGLKNYELRLWHPPGADLRLVV